MNNIKMIRISTHTLPWSVTYKEGGFTMAHMISTHTLTWSVTCRKIMTGQKTADFNSHAHVERDLADVPVVVAERDFNSHAHVERDRIFVCQTVVVLNFNSHAHVERDYQI